jgi:hypothetical protein
LSAYVGTGPLVAIVCISHGHTIYAIHAVHCRQVSPVEEVEEAKVKEVGGDAEFKFELLIRAPN